jgi:uncharacterized protein (DUF362 family)
MGKQHEERLLARQIMRRPFLRVVASTAAGIASAGSGMVPRRVGAASAYRVGVGSSPDAYTATKRAIVASGEWPGALLAGRIVVIKPNLVGAGAAATGMTTDPQVVRAVIDLTLDANPSQVLIVEGGRKGANFTACGYDFFRTYDPAGRIRLVDLSQEPVMLAPVLGGSAFRGVYVPRVVFDQKPVFITVAKLKTHAETVATLSLKNQFGLPAVPPYYVPTESLFRPRFHLHDRGVHQTIVDLNLMRRSHFAIVDAMWGMEGRGPVQGTPVQLNRVIAGRNALAVDRVCLQMMEIAPERVPYLTYAAQKALGPASLDAIYVAGDTYDSVPFLLPMDQLPPLTWRPAVNPSSFIPGSGQQTTVTFRLDARPDRLCSRRIEIISTSEMSSTIAPVCILREWEARPSGIESVLWDGRNSAGDLVAPGTYTVRIQARYEGQTIVASATNWIVVTA